MWSDVTRSIQQENPNQTIELSLVTPSLSHICADVLRTRFGKWLWETFPFLHWLFRGLKYLRSLRHLGTLLAPDSLQDQSVTGFPGLQVDQSILKPKFVPMSRRWLRHRLIPRQTGSRAKNIPPVIFLPTKDGNKRREVIAQYLIYASLE